MNETTYNQKRLARIIGLAMLAQLIIGVVLALSPIGAININLTGDYVATANAALDAPTLLRAKAWLWLILFGLSVLVAIGLMQLLRSQGPLLSRWAGALLIIASLAGLTSSVLSLNLAELADSRAFTDQPIALLAQMQLASDYTSFHTGLVISSVGLASFYWLFLRSHLIPRFLAGFGLFASLFVTISLVSRDFVSFMASDNVTIAFMICNLLSIILIGSYLTFAGIKTSAMPVEKTDQ